MPSPEISRRSSAATTDESSESDAEDSTPDFTISQLYTEANKFEKVLAFEGCIDDRGCDNDGANGFADLVGRDLDPTEKDTVGRATKLDAAGPTWIPGDITAEPESYDDSQGETSDASEASEGYPTPQPAFHRAATLESDSWKLTPNEIIPLLVDEFGDLTGDGEEEKLIFEADGCMHHDILILGVLHLTTHRLCFHANLLSLRTDDPDLPPSQKIIKAGSVTLHRRGWHVKRRVWIELHSDMICTYASSSDRDRLRPMRTLLLSSVKEILPADHKHPRHIEAVFEHDLDGYAEFDTVESAQQWRKELTGAMFLYRHRRREVMGSSSDANDAIRISCPLDRITSVSYSNSKRLASIRVEPTPSDTNHGEFSDSQEAQVFHMATVMVVDAWEHLEKYISAAKQRTAYQAPNLQSRVFLDFGSLSFSEVGALTYNRDDSSHKEKAVRHALALDAEPEVWIARARVARSIASSGWFVVSTHYVSFWSKSCARSDIKYRLAASTLKQAKPRQIKLLRVFNLALEIEGHSDLEFAFTSRELRDEAVERVNALSKVPMSAASALASKLSEMSTSGSDDSTSSLVRTPTDIFTPIARTRAVAANAGLTMDMRLQMPKVINLPHDMLGSVPSMHFVCLTIGSRGDVQPYIALGLGLLKEGHRVTIVTHQENKEWIEGFGLSFKQAGGDPGALMKLSVENKMFSPEFFKESLNNFRPWLDQLLLDAWESCQGADVLIESPSAMAGVHIAEALNIPYFRAFTMPWTKTAEFPHAFLSPPVESPTSNIASYILFTNVMWLASSGQINKWRRHTLKLPNTDMGHLAQSKITFIYNFSQAVVPKPLDWGDTTIISGYWFLDNPDPDWKPPAGLLEFMETAKKDGKPIVYIGFGSITVPDPNRTTARIVKAVLKSDVRAIISKGWSARMSKATDKDPEPEIPPQCFQLDKVPHDWLFPQMDAVLHHGGAGTTGASLRAGVPTLIKPWFGDQYFWASRVQKLGAGLKVSSMHSKDLAEALVKATTSRIMKEKAAAVGERIRSEDGVRNAIDAIYTYLPRAAKDRTLLDKLDKKPC